MSIHAADYRTSEKLQAILNVLMDGQFHSAREIREATGGIVEAVSARVCELRAKGNDLTIDHKVINGIHKFRLVKETLF